jgi:uncharacterized protein DUF6356
MMIRKVFTDHPATVGETYGEHFIQATRFAFGLLTASIACFIHGLVPGFFKSTGSTAVRKLHVSMVENRDVKTTDTQNSNRRPCNPVA